MPFRLLYAALVLCFLTVHGLAIQKLNAFASDRPATSSGIASGD